MKTILEKPGSRVQMSPNRENDADCLKIYKFELWKMQGRINFATLLPLWHTLLTLPPIFYTFLEMGSKISDVQHGKIGNSVELVRTWPRATLRGRFMWPNQLPPTGMEQI